jgi:SAM-dependent methyltransferase
MPYLNELWRESAERAAAAWRNGSAWRELAGLVRELAARVPEALREFPNAGLHQNNGADLAIFGDEQFDFAFSYIVFQHIPSREIIENYVREVRRVLKPGALFKFQVQGDPLYNAACDTWQGVGFTEEEMRDMAERCGFEMRYTYRADEQYLWLWFFKRPAGAAAQP